MIRKIYFATIIINILMFISIVGCQTIQQGPEKVYMRFWEACNSGDVATAESLITEDAKDKMSELGVCSFTHDYLNRISESLNTESLQEFISNSPETEIVGNTAYLKWTSKGGYVNTVILYKIDGKWKVHDSGFLGDIEQ